MTFRLTMLPAGDGDCLLLSWGSGERLTHAVIDGGRAGAYPRLRQMLSDISDKGRSSPYRS